MVVKQHAVEAALCAAGNKVTWRLYEWLGHDEDMHGPLVDAFSFADLLRAGQTYPSNCLDVEHPGPLGKQTRALFTTMTKKVVPFLNPE